MADITERITRKSLRAKKRAAIKTIKTQAREKIKEVKIQYAKNPERQQARIVERERKKALRVQKENARLAYNARQPRQYTLAEDLFNSISHGIGAGLSVAAIVLLILRAIKYAPAGKMPLYITSFTIFGVSMFLLYLMSTLYHALTPYGVRKVFSILNHTSIYLLIAGTYTPFALTTIEGVAGWVVFGIIWGFAALGIILYSVFGARMRNVSATTYIIMGWLIVFAFNPIVAKLPRISLAMLIAGGVAYTVGCVFYFLKKYKWSHSIFHLFVVVGSVMHFFSIYFSVPHIAV
jgi:hemolysin III